MILINSPIGTRVKLLTMRGEYLGCVSIKQYAKNYVDGFDDIRLDDKVFVKIRWDEAPEKIVIETPDILNVLDAE